MSIKTLVQLFIVITLCISPLSTVAAKSVYKIGGIFSSTGRASFLGDPEKRTMEMMVDRINANGGIDGHPLEAVIYDSEGDPAKAVSAVNKLIHRDKVLAIIGPSTTPTTLAVVNFVERAKIPLISCAAGIKITTPVKPWVFKTAQSDRLAVQGLYEHMRAKSVKTVGIITVANSFGESGREQLISLAKEYGITIVARESFGAKDTDTTAQLTKLKKAAPDALICWGTNPGPAVVAKNVQQLKIDIPLYQSHGVASPKFIALAGDSTEGIVLPTGKILIMDQLLDDDPQKQILQDYRSMYSASKAGAVSGFGGYAHDAMTLLVAALKGSNGDKQQIRDRLETLENHVGVTGRYSFSPKDHNGLSASAFVMVEIKNKTWNLLAP
jgi:branched-chain amino acid transport system substrate-binding protein